MARQGTEGSPGGRFLDAAIVDRATNRLANIRAKREQHSLEEDLAMYFSRHPSDIVQVLGTVNFKWSLVSDNLAQVSDIEFIEADGRRMLIPATWVQLVKFLPTAE